MSLFALPFPAIDPVLISFGPIAVRWYALAYIAGILLGWIYMKKLVADARLWGATSRPAALDVDDFVFWAAVGIVLGGRIGYVLFYNSHYYFSHPLEIFAVWSGGMAFHGGFLGVVIAMIFYARSRGLRFWTFFDLAATAAPIGLFFGRLANFINAELWGRVSDVPWAFVFPGAGPEPRHPSQLYEAALEGVALFFFIRLLTHRFKTLRRPGLTAGAFALGYGAARSFAELFRMPDAQIGFFSGGLTMGMLLSAPMMLAGAGAIFWSLSRPAPNDPTPNAPTPIAPSRPKGTNT